MTGGFGANNTGTVDTAPAFTQFNIAALAAQSPGDQVQLTIPAGYYWFASTNISGGSNSQFWGNGIYDLLVLGAGAGTTTLSDTDIAGTSNASGFFFGGGLGSGVGYRADIPCLIQNVDANSTSVELVTAADASNFSVGMWALVLGIDLQLGGSPPNPGRHDWVQITSITGTTIKTIHFSTPLKRSYKTNWPSDALYTGDASKNLGPATIYPTLNWDGIWEYRDLTNSQVEQVHSWGRSVTFRNVTNIRSAGSSSPHCSVFPSVNQTFNMINCDNTAVGSLIEVDKIVDTFYMSGCSVRSMEVQSSSVDVMHLDGCTFTNFMNGTPRYALIENCTIASFTIGTTAFGHTEEVILRNSTISGLSIPTTFQDIISFGITMNNGVLKLPNNLGGTTGLGPYGFADPGTWLMWGGAMQSELAFQVMDVTADASFTYVSTTWPGGFPDSSFFHSGTSLNLRTHPCPRLTVINCVGLEDWSGCHVPGDPIYSHSHRYYSSDGSVPGTELLAGDGSGFPMWGKITSWVANVTRAHTGTATTLKAASQFDNLPVVHGDANSSPTVAFDFGSTAHANLNAIGVNNFTPATYLWTGDTVQPFANNVSSDGPSNIFIVDIQIDTNQGIQPSVVTLMGQSWT
jgi:hypothetical protein